MEKEKIKPRRYRHYKGGLYEVIGTARNTETLEELVVYRQLYDAHDYPKGTLWARPAKMFFGNVDSNGNTVPRFTPA